MLAPRRGCCACLLSSLAGRCWASPADSRHPLRAVPGPDPPIPPPARREGFGSALPRSDGWPCPARRVPGFFLGVLPARGTPNPLFPPTLRTGAVSIPPAGLFPIAGGKSRCPQPEQGLHPKKPRVPPSPPGAAPHPGAPGAHLSAAQRSAGGGTGPRPLRTPQVDPSPLSRPGAEPHELPPAPFNPPHNRSPFTKPSPARRVR